MAVVAPNVRRKAGVGYRERIAGDEQAGDERKVSVGAPSIARQE
jgi:hypothetical protein